MGYEDQALVGEFVFLPVSAEYGCQRGADYKVKATFLPTLLILVSTVWDLGGFYRNTLDTYRAGGLASLLFVGGVANDKVFNTVELFFDGLIDKTEAINRLRYEKPNLQISFRTEKALSLLHFEGSETL